MTFRQSVETCLKQKYFFNFTGRASRSEFWWFMLFIFGVNFITGIFFAILPTMLAASLSMIISLLLLPANLGVTVRRLHDRNLSGWWLIAPLGCLALAILFGTGGGFFANILSLAMTVAYLIILCMPGDPTPNKYGPPPAV